ncbi:hypothetical protein ABH20_01010 [Geobacillus sp. T6]|uniref:hypothetical protein n=1 Tax=Geobacillus sp. T6 TaxID=1659191 RepID=UPI0006497DCC|nr:hypothetical protein [Geobacillus sp. T6]KLR75301.1 hypothetical protein ABH20_01010 [Geobacillus sp. T6]
MYSVQQLQALDCLLKKVVGDHFKLVIELNGQYWYGDFVRLDGNALYQHFIDGIGAIEKHTFYIDSPNAPNMVKKIWQSYLAAIEPFRRHPFGSNPFERLRDLSLLFETLVNILAKADIADEDSPLSPCLFNARSLNGDGSLPFIYLGNEKLKLVSLIRIAEE